MTIKYLDNVLPSAIAKKIIKEMMRCGCNYRHLSLHLDENWGIVQECKNCKATW